MTKMKNFLIAALLLIPAAVLAQDRVHYSGDELVNTEFLNGRLTPVVGVHNIQVFRANREAPWDAEDLGWTYNHAPMIAYWNGTYYVEYLANPANEHTMPGAALLSTSKDGYSWSRPKVVFPIYALPAGVENANPKRPGKLPEGATSVVHHRMGFYVSKSGKLLVSSYYGISLDAHDKPNDTHGVGRVVRELKADGSEGPIYFIRYNKPFGPSNTSFPFYKDSKDKAFVAAVDELLANRLVTQQWEEEADEDDPIVSLHGAGKAFCYYHLDDGRVVGLWKTTRTAISSDEGKTWSKVERAPGVVNGTAKTWGQRTSDGKFALVYNPSHQRWPLAISTSDDGLDFKNLWLIHGDGEGMRYPGHYKDYGPQYMRGIAEGNGTPPEGAMWMTYSYSKDDIWVSKIPVPVRAAVTGPVDDTFDRMPAGHELDQWNIYSPTWARTGIETRDGVRQLTLHDKDPYNYAKALRTFPDAQAIEVEFTFTPVKAERTLYIDIQDAHGYASVRLAAQDGQLRGQGSNKFEDRFLSYEEGKSYQVRLRVDCRAMNYSVSVNGQAPKTGNCYAPVRGLHMIEFRTGNAMITQNFNDNDRSPDLPYAGTAQPEAVWAVSQLKITKL